MKPLIIIPTYNERENIEPLVNDVLGRYQAVEVLVVDDNSPDGTGDAVTKMKSQNPRVHLLSRPGKQGLGKAYLAGFKWGLDKGYDRFVEMDADFSHRPEDLGKLLEASQDRDVVIGSRYVPGGAVRNWGILRQFISRGGSLYARLILWFALKDWTGGFNLWSRKALEGLGLDSVRSEGYSFQIELKYRALKRGFSHSEVPILFEDRRVGQSKMSSRIFLEALLRVWQIRFRS